MDELSILETKLKNHFNRKNRLTNMKLEHFFEKKHTKEQLASIEYKLEKEAEELKAEIIRLCGKILEHEENEIKLKYPNIWQCLYSTSETYPLVISKWKKDL